MESVRVRNIQIGEGVPKICVPIVGAGKEEIIRGAEEVRRVSADIAEWRADWYEDVFDESCVRDILETIREMLGETPLLFTFRSLKEGGEREIDLPGYVKLNCAVSASGLVDLIDVEAFTGDEPVSEMIEEAHKHQVKVVASNHDFGGTPQKEEIIRRLCKMQELGADIYKIAVMPENRKDVLTLLAATEEMVREYAERPVITMSMSGEGAVSRLCAEAFGSAVTFGSAGRVSAPGQVDAGKLRTALDILHESMMKS